MTEKNENASELAKLGAAKGGAVRAQRLTAEERSDIARAAARRRWGDQLPQAQYPGELVIGGATIACAVLSDRRRVLTQETFLTAVGRAPKAKGGTGSESGGLPPFLSANNLAPFITPEISALAEPIPFRGERGVRAWGYDAQLLPGVCMVYIEAELAGKLLASQKRMVDSCKRLVSALASVGIVALVDNATGYEEVRARDELQKILEAYIAPELMPWTRRFPDAFFEQIYRLQKWEFKPGSAKRTPFVGHLINQYVYQQLPPGVLEKLREINPTNEKGQRRHKHHQFLTPETGEPHLDRQIAGVTTLMRAAEDKEQFIDLFNRAFPKLNQQGRLPLVIPPPAQPIALPQPSSQSQNAPPA